MLQRDAPGPFAAGTGGQDVFARPHGVGRRPRDPRKRRDVEDANGDDGVDDACPKHGGEHNGQQQGREGKREVGQAHDGFFHPALACRRQQPQRRAHAHADAHGDHPHQNGIARTHHEEREDVAPERISAQPVGGRRGLQLGGQVHLVGRPGRPH